ncbi:MAG: flagellar biosynthesis protein FlhF, partial [Ectothiorhodospiraceae bacterium]
MKIKRVFAADMRQAIRKVREEHGPDAVILSSRNVEGGVEVISAMDYDEKAVRAAVEQSDTRQRFSDMLGEAQREAAPTPSAGGARPGGISLVVDDEPEPAGTSGGGNLSFATEPPEPSRPDPAPAPSAAKRIEWSQDPAMKEMREELRTLRSLFQNQMHLLEWQQLGQRHPVRAALYKRLHEVGLGPDVCRKLADHVADTEDPEAAWGQAVKLVRRHLPVTDDDIVANGGIVAVVGATGVGKTTTVAKLAARYALRHGKRHVALVTTDNYRIGGQDQLRSFARILGVSVYAAGSREELASVLEELRDKHLVLVDTAGMSQRDMRLSAQFRTLAEAGHDIRPYLVVSANTQLPSLMEILRAFRKVRPVGCIISKVDEAASLGPVITAVLRSRLPVAYVGTGQRVPEDLAPARSDTLVEEAVAL